MPIIETVRPKSISPRILLDCNYARDYFRFVMHFRQLLGFAVADDPESVGGMQIIPCFSYCQVFAKVRT